jgi:hypothetical protein
MAAMEETYDTAIGLLNQAAETLTSAAQMCEEPADARELVGLADRITAYLATSRSSTMLGMPRIVSSATELSDEMVVRRRDDAQPGHVRIVPN